MYTPEQVAQQINATKPDFTEFIDLINKGNSEDLKSHIANTTDIFAKLFKAEIVLMYYQSHPNRYLRNNTESSINDLLAVKLNSRATLSKSVSIWRIYTVNTFKQDPTPFILNFVISTKPYLPNYLYRKLNPPTSTATIKQLRDDAFTLAVFKANLASKPNSISSVQAEAYINSISRFELTKHEYMQLILDNCPKPSLKLQSLLEGILPDQCGLDNPTKYMELRKYNLRWDNKSHNRIIAGSHIFNTRDSEYKPFITNLPRTPTPDKQQTEYLIDALTKLQVDYLIAPETTTQVFIESLAEHLNLPEYKDVIKDNLERYELQIRAYQAVINLFKDN